VPQPCPIVGEGCFLGNTILSRSLLEVKYLSKDYFSIYLYTHSFFLLILGRSVSYYQKRKKEKTEVRHFGN
jgi:hypothetical protein